MMLKNIDKRGIVALILFSAALIYAFTQKPVDESKLNYIGGSNMSADQRSQEMMDTFAKNFTVLHDENGKAITEPCFLKDPFPSFEQVSTKDWVQVEYYNWHHTTRFLVPPEYTLNTETKSLQTNDPLYERVAGTVHIGTEDFLNKVAYDTGYRNDYGVVYSPDFGWAKEYLLNNRYMSGLCEPNPSIEVNDKKIFKTWYGDAGAVGENFILVFGDTVVTFSMSYTFGGDAGEGLDIPDHPEEVVSHVRNILLTMLGTVEVVPNE